MSVHIKGILEPKKAVPNYRDFRGSDSRNKYPSLQPKGRGTLKEDDSYKHEVSSKYTIAPAYSKGAYQVIPLDEVVTAGRKV